MNIVVTGSDGFLGRELCRRLDEEGHLLSHIDIQRGAHYDITDPEIIGFEMWRSADYCIHLAAMADITVTKDKRWKTFKVNVGGTFNVSEACRVYDIPLIYASQPGSSLYL